GSFRTLFVVEQQVEVGQSSLESRSSAARAGTSSRSVARSFFGSRASSSGSGSSGRPAFISAGAPAAVLHGRRGAGSAAAPVFAAGRAASRVALAFGANSSPALSIRGGGVVAMMSTSGAATPVPPLSVGDMCFTAESKASVSVSPVSTADAWEGDMLVLLAFQQEDKEAFAALAGDGAVAADKGLEGAVADMISSQEFKGEKKGSISAMLGSKSGVKRVAVIGLGKKDDSSLIPSSLEAIGTQLAALAKSSKCKSMAVVLPEGCGEGSTQSLTQGALIGMYADQRYKTRKEDKKDLPLQSIDIIGGEESAGLDAAKAVASGVSLCRDLVNSPPNMLTPGALADAAAKIAEDHGLECEILEEEEIVALGMGAYMGVAQGAVFPPKFIHLTYKPSGTPKKKVALIGKGLTFDSGGYNIKAGAGSMIELMKFDMGGSACTLGAAKAIGQLKPDGVEAHFIVAACENMVSEKAMRPGDILTASNGKTIEVLNTDAEGRLTLADALVFAEKLGVDAIIDSATLTGACLVS
ncbi:unnamed protein product, partial [Ectocarpus sp. 13 AM-2016]